MNETWNGISYPPPAGTWVVCEGKVQLVKDVRDSYVSVSDGSFETSGDFRGRLFPLTLKNKAWGESVMSWAKRARGYEGNAYGSRINTAGLNHPDINRAFLALHDACLSIPEEDADGRGRVCDEARELAYEIERAVKDAGYTEVKGIRIFGR